MYLQTRVYHFCWILAETFAVATEFGVKIQSIRCTADFMPGPLSDN